MFVFLYFLPAELLIWDWHVKKVCLVIWSPQWLTVPLRVAGAYHITQWLRVLFYQWNLISCSGQCIWFFSPANLWPAPDTDYYMLPILYHQWNHTTSLLFYVICTMYYMFALILYSSLPGSHYKKNSGISTFDFKHLIHACDFYSLMDHQSNMIKLPENRMSYIFRNCHPCMMTTFVSDERTFLNCWYGWSVEYLPNMC